MIRVFDNAYQIWHEAYHRFNYVVKFNLKSTTRLQRFGELLTNTIACIIHCVMFHDLQNFHSAMRCYSTNLSSFSPQATLLMHSLPASQLARPEMMRHNTV